MKIIKKIIITVLFLSTATALYAAPSAPTNLLTEGQTDPVNADKKGINVSNPYFSWTSSTDTTKYRIILADNVADITNNVGNFWDYTLSTTSSYSYYSGTNTFTSNKQYWWKVAVWDMYDSTSTWSNSGTFETNHFINRQKFDILSNQMAFAVGDINGDGLRDFVEAEWNLERVTAYVNNGTGTFNFSWQNSTQTYPANSQSVALADLDMDNDLDLIVLNGNNNPNHIYINDGSGSFTYLDNAINSGPGPANFSICTAVGDIDRDGNLDFIDGSQAKNQINLNNGDGTFTVNTSTWIGGYTSTTKDMILADMDGDGYLDLVTGNDAASNRVFFNQKNPPYFSAAAVWEDGRTSDKTYALTLIDIDGDGDWDFIAGNTDTTADVIYKNNGDRTFTASAIADADSTYALTSADVDNDGDMDYIAGLANTNDKIYENNGSGTFTDTYHFFEYGQQPQSYKLNVNDLTGDGACDLLRGIYQKGITPEADYFMVHHSAISNSGPPAPENLYAQFDDSKQRYKVSWNPPTGGDDNTPNAELSYNIRFGTTTCDYHVISGAIGSTDNSGSFWGNIGRSTYVFLNLPTKTYFWSVQAIDNSKSTGTWATEQIINERPIGGWDQENILLSTCTVQWTTDRIISSTGVFQSARKGLVDVHFKVKDREKNDCLLLDFAFSTSTTGQWTTITDTDTALTQENKDPEVNQNQWPDNNGNNFAAVSSSTAPFSEAAEYSFLWDTSQNSLLSDNQCDTVQLRFKIADIYGSTSTYYSSSTVFSVDNKTPTPPGMLSSTDSFTSTEYTLLFGPASDDSNFSEYKIFYASYTGVTQNNYTGLWTQADDAALSSRTYGGKSSTTVTGLTADTTYYFTIYAYDLYGNNSSTDSVKVKTNDPPALAAAYGVTKVTATQRTDGSNLVDITFYALDNDIEVSSYAFTQCYYRISGSTYVMTASISDPSFSPEPLSLSKTESQFNYVWVSSADIPDVTNGNVQVQIALNDGRDTGSSDLSNPFMLDTLAPDMSALNFIGTTSDAESITWCWNNPVTEINFTKYELWYSTIATGQYAVSKDTNYAQYITMTDQAQTSTTTYNLQQFTRYWACLWAYDSFGHETRTSTSSFMTGYPPYVSVSTQPAPFTDGTGKVEFSINISDPDGSLCEFRAQYSTSPTGGWQTAYLELSTATYGSPYIDNTATETFRLKNITTEYSTVKITNTVTLGWLSKTDRNNYFNNAMYMRFTAHDATVNSNMEVSSSFRIDNSQPYFQAGPAFSTYYSTGQFTMRFSGEYANEPELISTTSTVLSRFIVKDDFASPASSIDLSSSTVTAVSGYLNIYLPDSLTNQIARWDGQGKNPYMTLLSSATTDTYGNYSLKKSTIRFNADIWWSRDETRPTVSTATYSTLEEDIKLILDFAEYMDVRTSSSTDNIDITGIRLSSAPTPALLYEQLDSSWTLLTQDFDSKTITFKVPETANERILDWPTNNYYLLIDSVTVKDLSGNYVVASSTNNIYPIIPRIEADIPYVTAAKPADGSYNMTRSTFITVLFNENLKSNITQSVIVRQIKDAQDNNTFLQIAGSAQYSSKRLTFTPSSPLPGNSLIRVTVNREDVQNYEGELMESNYTWTFRTRLTSAESNLLTSPSGNVQIFIPANQLPANGRVEFTENIPPNAPAQTPMLSVQAANSSEATWDNPYHYQFDTLTTELIYYTQADAAADQIFTQDAELYFHYDDYVSDEDSRYVKYGDRPPVKAKTLKVYYLDENMARWVQLNSQVDTKAMKITAPTRHFSVYTVMGSQNYDLEDSHPYPVPYKPSERPAAFDNTIRAGIIFTDLPSECEIEIFTISGRLVRTLSHSDAEITGAMQPGNYYWYPVDNLNGEDIVSGVYIYHIETEGNSKSGKLMIIR